MKDKDIVALITIAFFILYFYPSDIMKFLSIAFILFFAPGFFILKSVYKDMDYEELILLSFPLSISIFGTLALIFSIFSILTPENVLISSAAVIIPGYFFSSSLNLKLRKIEMPDKLGVILIALMLGTMGVWLGVEFNTTQYKEMDIGIKAWPKNSTINSTISFDIYVKNQNYGYATCRIVFYLNRENVSEKIFTLKNGEYRVVTFNAKTNITGENLASFDLYVNKKYYTNVHVYFQVKGST